MIKIYGTMLCPDCVACCDALDKAGISYDFLEFSQDIRNLKDFLKIRDHHALFDGPKAEGSIGIPCLLLEDGTLTLDWTEIM